MGDGGATTTHGDEFAAIVRQARHAVRHPRRAPEEHERGKSEVVLRAVRKTLRDRDLLEAGMIMFEDHLPVRVGVRYLFGLLQGLTGWKRRDLRVASAPAG